MKHRNNMILDIQYTYMVILQLQYIICVNIGTLYQYKVINIILFNTINY